MLLSKYNLNKLVGLKLLYLLDTAQDAVKINAVKMIDVIEKGESYTVGDLLLNKMHSLHTIKELLDLAFETNLDVTLKTSNCDIVAQILSPKKIYDGVTVEVLKEFHAALMDICDSSITVDLLMTEDIKFCDLLWNQGIHVTDAIRYLNHVLGVEFVYQKSKHVIVMSDTVITEDTNVSWVINQINISRKTNNTDTSEQEKTHLYMGPNIEFIPAETNTDGEMYYKKRTGNIVVTAMNEGFVASYYKEIKTAVTDRAVTASMIIDITTTNKDRDQAISALKKELSKYVKDISQLNSLSPYTELLADKVDFVARSKNGKVFLLIESTEYEVIFEEKKDFYLDSDGYDTVKAIRMINGQFILLRYPCSSCQNIHIVKSLMKVEKE